MQTRDEHQHCYKIPQVVSTELCEHLSLISFLVCNVHLTLNFGHTFCAWALVAPAIHSKNSQRGLDYSVKSLFYIDSFKIRILWSWNRTNVLDADLCFRFHDLICKMLGKLFQMVDSIFISSSWNPSAEKGALKEWDSGYFFEYHLSYTAAVDLRLSQYLPDSSKSILLRRTKILTPSFSSSSWFRPLTAQTTARNGTWRN